MRKYLVCPHCRGRFACLRDPAFDPSQHVGEPVMVADVEHIDGRPITGSEEIRCDTCGEGLPYPPVETASEE